MLFRSEWDPPESTPAAVGRGPWSLSWTVTNNIEEIAATRLQDPQIRTKHRVLTAHYVMAVELIDPMSGEVHGMVFFTQTLPC